MVETKLYIKKIKRACRSAVDAWWVLLIIVSYSVFAWLFTGTSCVSASITGFPCPACGVSRAFFELLNGNISGSVRYHPLLIPGIIISCVYFTIWLTNEKIPRQMDKILIPFIIIIIAVYIIRMVLMFPSDFPMVYNHNAIIPRVINSICIIF